MSTTQSEHLTCGNGAWARLFNGDAFRIRDHLIESGTVPAAVITDPPYGIRYRSRHKEGRSGAWARYIHGPSFPMIRGDDRAFDPSPWLELAAANRKTRLIFWGANYFASRLPDSRCWLVWDKLDGCKSSDLSDVELAWTNLDRPARMYSHLWRGLCRRGEENIAKGSRKLHPHQKPVALMDWTLTLAKLEAGDVVFDPYMGSASLGVACLRRGIHYIGAEIEAHYFGVAVQRLQVEASRLETELAAVVRTGN